MTRHYKMDVPRPNHLMFSQHLHRLLELLGFGLTFSVGRQIEDAHLAHRRHKPTAAHADQPHRSSIRSLRRQQILGDAGDLVAVINRVGHGDLPGAGGEVGPTQFEGDGASGQAVALQTGGYLGGLLPQRAAQGLRIRHILRECRLLTDRFGLPLGDQQPLIDPLRLSMEIMAQLAEAPTRASSSAGAAAASPTV